MSHGGEERAYDLRRKILELAAEYAHIAHAPKAFVPGESPVPVSGKVFDGSDMRSLVDSALDFWLTPGRFNRSERLRVGKEWWTRLSPVQ